MTSTDTNAEAFAAFRELVIATAMQISTHNPALSIEETMTRAAQWVANKVVTERPEAVPALIANLK